MKYAALFLIKLYQLLASAFKSLMGEPQQCCRFYPSCSEYAVQAVEQHGAWKGTWLAVRRVARCHPWNKGGIDLVPQKKT